MVSHVLHTRAHTQSKAAWLIVRGLRCRDRASHFFGRDILARLRFVDSYGYVPYTSQLYSYRKILHYLAPPFDSIFSSSANLQLYIRGGTTHVSPFISVGVYATGNVHQSPFQASLSVMSKSFCRFLMLAMSLSLQFSLPTNESLPPHLGMFSGHPLAHSTEPRPPVLGSS